MSRKTRRAEAEKVELAAPARMAPPVNAEVASIFKTEMAVPIALNEFPNFSAIIGTKAEGQGLRFYDTMLGTDSDLAGNFEDLFEAVLHYPTLTRAANDSPEAQTHAQFCKWALRQIPHRQNFLRHLLTSYPKGFAVAEKMYEVVTRGEWTGSVIYSDILDKPQRWFTFDAARRLRLKTFTNQFPGELVPQEKFLVVTYGTNSNPWGTPLLDLVYWPYRLKHHALKNQALFMEKWASPTPAVEYEWDQDATVNRRNLEKALEVAMSFQNDQAIALPKGMILNLIESARNGSVSFEGYIKQLTDTASRLVTGQVLSTSGSDGGSYALGAVHERKEKTRSETLADFLSAQVTRLLYRELVDRNFGPQDDYPQYLILCKSAGERMSEALLEQQEMKNGHRLSRTVSSERLQIVGPLDDDDELTPPAPAMPTGSPPALPLAGDGEPSMLAAAPAGLYEVAAEKATEIRARLEKISADSLREAKPGIKKVVKALASLIRGKSSIAKVRLEELLKNLRKVDVSGLATAFDRMLGRPEKVEPAKLATGDVPPEITAAAKLSLSLMLLAIVDRVASALDDAKDLELGSEEVADSILDEHGLDVPGHFSAIFESTHGTNIASVQAAKLRERLGDPAFRQKYPYVLIVANPGARPSHQAMDGFIMSSEEALSSIDLPPFDFGCRCQAVPISAATARKFGVTGARPVGNVSSFLKSQGASPTGAPGEFMYGGARIRPGLAPGFRPSYAEVDFYTQLDALRAKAEELRRSDVSAYAALVVYLTWLFGFDILKEDPPQADRGGFNEEDF